MAAPDLLTGFNAKTEIVPDLPGGGAGTPVMLTSTSWVLTRVTNPVELNNTRDGRVRRPGLGDYTGSVNGTYDPDADPLQLIPETPVVTLNLYTDHPRGKYSGRFLCDNIQIDTQGLEDGIQWSFDISLAEGTITFTPGT